jgi:hypothetical protein
MADCVAERTTKSIVQTPQHSVEQFLTRLTAEQAHVDACTRLIDAECISTS